MKGQLIFICFLLVTSLSRSQNLTEKNMEAIKSIIQYTKTNNVEKLKTLVLYPLEREFPIPNIQNEEEFVKRYEEVFDPHFKNLLIHSNINSDWSIVGWRGIMFNRGMMWLEEQDGKIRSINYQSQFEYNSRLDLIEKDKKSLHKSIRDFESPVLHFKTDSYRVRIDKLKNGSFRYTVWSIESHKKDRPDLVINDGKKVSKGNGGNHDYEFQNMAFTYICSVNVLRGPQTPSKELSVLKNGVLLLREEAK